jgi:hypothetical protein
LAGTWHDQLMDLLKRTAVPVTALVTTEDSLDLTLDFGDGRSLSVELKPRGQGACGYAETARFRVGFRGQADLAQAERRTLDRLVNVLRKLEGRLPQRLPPGSAGDVTADGPEEALTRRFPFLTVERFLEADGQGGQRHVTEVLIRATPRCNQACPFCSAPPAPLPSTDGLRQCLQTIDASLPGAHVSLTGGEPTLRPTFAEELKLALSLPGIASVQVQTNAVGFARGAAMAALPPPSPHLRWFVSLHACEESLYDQCTGTTGQLPLALTGMRNLLVAGHALTQNTVVSALNLDHLDDLMRAVPGLFQGLPLPDIHYSILMVPEYNPNAAQYLTRYTDLAPALERAAAVAEGTGLTVQPLVSSTHASIPLCLVGEAHRVASTHRPLIRPHETGYEDLTRPWVKAHACRACPATDHCLGVPAAYARHFGLDELDARRMVQGGPIGPPGGGGLGGHAAPQGDR